jgi:hypothetical protein
MHLVRIGTGFKHGNDPLGCAKGAKFDWLSDC